MGVVLITPLAREDLGDIWDYAAESGEERADRAATPEAGSPIHLLAPSRPVVLLSYYAGYTTDFRGEAG